MIEKEVLTLSDIRKRLGKKDNKAGYLKGFIEDPTYKNIRKDIVKELAQIVTKKPIMSYNLIYDSLSEGLEPIYFWVLDFMRDSAPAGLGLTVWKGAEESESSVSSGYFGEIGQRATLMQQKAMEYLGAINNVIKSILNLIYDLKEFEIRLNPYDELRDENLDSESKKAALYALKGVWMDQVDIKKGRGSINMLAQELQFVTLRDAFFYVNSVKEINDLDLNSRVKNIIKRKLEEFSSWKKYSEAEIRKRYQIEKTYLKSQAGTLKLYASWAKPYLISAQKLKMKGTTPQGLMNPNIINAFSNMEIEIKLLGKKEIKPGAIHQSFHGLTLDRKYYAVTEIIMKFRSVPSALSGQGGRHYVHGGRTDLTFNAYAMDDLDLEAVESQELLEDLELIDEYIGTSLTTLQEDIENYTKDEEPEPKKKTKKQSTLVNPFKGLFDGFQEVYSPLKDTFVTKRKGPSIAYEELESVTKKKAKSQTYTIYKTYKKTHGMIAE